MDYYLNPFYVFILNYDDFISRTRLFGMKFKLI